MAARAPNPIKRAPSPDPHRAPPPGKGAADDRRPTVLALDPADRVPWSLALRLAAEVTAAAFLFFLTLVAPGSLFAWVQALIWFLLARIVADAAAAFSGRTVGGTVVEGLAKGISWAILVLAVNGTLLGESWFGSLWVTGLALALAGLAWWGHKTKALPIAPAAGMLFAVLGAAAAPAGIGLTLTVVALPAPWHVALPAATIVIGYAVAARGVWRMRHNDPRAAMAAGGWSAWYQAHFFRLTVLLGAVVAYLFVRPSLQGQIPFLFLFEYSGAVFVLGVLLWSLRSHLGSRIVPLALASPHRTHEQEVERQGETRFDDTEAAFGAFIELGDTERVKALAADLERDGFSPGDALDPVLGYNRPDRLLLVHPAWLYGGRLGAGTLIAFALAAALGGADSPELGSFAPVAFGWVLAGTLYTAQWNRFGGPVWAKIGLAYLGLALLPVFDSGRAFAATLSLGPIGLAVLGTLVALPLVHPLRARRGRPVPRFGFVGSDPKPVLDQLQAMTEASVVRRTLWVLGLGIVAFFILGELERLIPGIGILFGLYIVIGLLVLLSPVLLAAGLRLGRRQVAHRHAHERAQRARMLDAALERLERRWTTEGLAPGTRARRRQNAAPARRDDGHPPSQGSTPIPSPESPTRGGFRPVG